MHHLHSFRLDARRAASFTVLLFAILCAPGEVMAQASPFMTGATALQTNARVAREYLVALPVELSAGQRLALTRAFAHELSDRYQFALDVAIHAPRDYPGSDPRNFHAHLLATTREVQLRGLGDKTTLEWRDSARREVGLGPAVAELFHVRQRWAESTNLALQEAELAVRVDHRSLRAQGIDREPYPHIPRAAFEMERHGYRSFQAERIREAYQASLAAREREQQKGSEQTRSEQTRSKQTVAERTTTNEPPKTAEQIRHEARESWLRMRESRTDTAPASERLREDDLTL